MSGEPSEQDVALSGANCATALTARTAKNTN